MKKHEPPLQFHTGVANPAYLLAALLRQSGRQDVRDRHCYISEHKEYDYEMDASMGQMCGCHHSANGDAPMEDSQTFEVHIGWDQAIQLVLSHVPGAQASHVRWVKLMRKDGYLQYQVEVVYRAMRYHVKMDACTGRVLSRYGEPVT